MSKDFVRLVMLAFLIAVPVAMLVISLLILSIRAGRAALANPVNSLRTE